MVYGISPGKNFTDMYYSDKKGVVLMSRRVQTNKVIYKTPRRGEIWLIVDRDKKHDKNEQNQEYDSSVQGGTRMGVIVSNNDGIHMLR